MDQDLMAEYQVSRKDILSFAWQVARGMDYLSKKKVKCTHNIEEKGIMSCHDCKQNT